MRFRVNLKDEMVKALADNVKAYSQAQLLQVQARFRELALEAETRAKSMAAQRLSSTKHQYIDALRLENPAPNFYVLVLDESASHLEEGYGAFDMKEGMLSSKAIVKTGKRAGQPWVRVGKDGSRYAAVPFDQSGAAARPSHPEHDRPVQRGQSMETTRGQLAQDLKYLTKLANAAQIGAGINSGKAWTATKSQSGPTWSLKDALGRHTTMALSDRPIHPNLSGLTAFRRTTPGGKVMTNYMTWRMVSDKSTGWKHPGYHGAHLFPDLARWLQDQITVMLQEIFQP